MTQDPLMPGMPAPVPAPASQPVPIGPALVVATSADAKATLETATAEIRRLVETISTGFIQLGFWLKRVRDEKLYEAHGHATFEDYLKGEVETSREYAYATIKVVERLSMDRASRLGFEKARAFLSYVDATPAQETPEEMMLLLVPVKRDGVTVFLPPEEATSRELWDAAHLLRDRQAGTGGASSDPSIFLLKARPALQRLGIPLASDAASVTFGPVPVALLREFVAVLKASMG